MPFVNKAYENAAASIIKEFKRHNMEACYCATIEEAREKVLSLIPEGSSVTWGGTQSMAEAGVCDAISNGNYEFIDRKSANTPEEARALFGRIVCADYFLTSTNAFTKDGILVNIDGASNRVACIAHGPAHVIVLASMNKMCDSVEDAFKRIRTHACPPNSLRVNVNTPCSKTGICSECLSPENICCNFLVTRYSKVPGRIQVILCGEKLGF